MTMWITNQKNTYKQIREVKVSRCGVLIFKGCRTVLFSFIILIVGCWHSLHIKLQVESRASNQNDEKCHYNKRDNGCVCWLRDVTDSQPVCVCGGVLLKIAA